MDPQRIRNFSVIAQIDHGKSTLADRFLELTGALLGMRRRGVEAQTLANAYLAADDNLEIIQDRP